MLSPSHAPTATSVNTYGLTTHELMAHLRVSRETIEGWVNGSRQRPPYFDAAVKAARAGLQPVARPLVRKYAKDLGVPESQVKFWLNSGQVPAPARMAVAWFIHCRVTGRG